MEKKEAMKILKKFHDKSALFSVRTALDTVIPELKENEDDRIGKDIIAYMRYERKSTKQEIVNRFIPWLEKQCKNCLVNLNEAEQEKYDNVNEETNAPTEYGGKYAGYGKYVDECLNEAAKHFFSEGEDKYSVADLFYAGVRCGESLLEKQGEQNPVDKENPKIENANRDFYLIPKKNNND